MNKKCIIKHYRYYDEIKLSRQESQKFTLLRERIDALNLLCHIDKKFIIAKLNYFKTIPVQYNENISPAYVRFVKYGKLVYQKKMFFLTYNVNIFTFVRTESLVFSLTK